MELMSAEIKDLAAALSKAQSEIEGAKKDSQNPFYKSRYADLESVWDSCRTAITKQGLSVAQQCMVVDKENLLVTTLMHSSGQWIRGVQAISPKDNSPQAIGSAITYARRYGLAAMLGIYQTDDDAEAAMNRPQSALQNQAQPAQSRPANSYPNRFNNNRS